MRARPKPLREQVIVITGASSGIGLATARRAVRRGARVVLASRSEDDLSAIASELNAPNAAGGHDRHGPGRAAWVAADVANPEDVRKIAETALSHFGGFDTWVNNAGLTVYGRAAEVPLAEARRLFDVDFWGVVHGSLEALNHFRQRSRGGTLINMGSVSSDVALPLQAYYTASKHAVKGFTDALRVECEKDGLPVNITLIKPTTIDTPFFEHAASHMRGGVGPKGPDPAYSPDIVADAILFAARHPRRDILVGGAGRVISTLGKVAPRAMDYYARAMGFSQQQSPERAGRARNTLFTPAHGHETRGGHPGWVRDTSIYTKISERPIAATLVAGGVGLLAAAALSAAVPAATSIASPRSTTWRAAATRAARSMTRPARCAPRSRRASFW